MRSRTSSTSSVVGSSSGSISTCTWCRSATEWLLNSYLVLRRQRDALDDREQPLGETLELEPGDLAAGEDAEVDVEGERGGRARRPGDHGFGIDVQGGDCRCGGARRNPPGQGEREEAA